MVPLLKIKHLKHNNEHSVITRLEGALSLLWEGRGIMRLETSQGPLLRGADEDGGAGASAGQTLERMGSEGVLEGDPTGSADGRDVGHEGKGAPGLHS